MLYSLNIDLVDYMNKETFSSRRIVKVICDKNEVSFSCKFIRILQKIRILILFISVAIILYFLKSKK